MFLKLPRSFQCAPMGETTVHSANQFAKMISVAVHGPVRRCHFPSTKELLSPFLSAPQRLPQSRPSSSLPASPLVSLPPVSLLGSTLHTAARGVFLNKSDLVHGSQLSKLFLPHRWICSRMPNLTIRPSPCYSFRQECPCQKSSLNLHSAWEPHLRHHLFWEAF